VIRGSFELLEPSWRCPLRRSNASNAIRRSRNSSRFMTPREVPSRPPSGLSSPWEAVLLSHRLEFVQKPMPSWFSSSLGFDQPDLPNGRHHSLRSRAFAWLAPLRVQALLAPQRISRTGGGGLSLERANPSEVSPLGCPTSSKSKARWVMDSPQVRPPVAGRPLPSSHAVDLCQSSVGQPLGPR
jgi:hypothetical protein